MLVNTFKAGKSHKIPAIAATAKEDMRMEIEIGLISFDHFAKPFNLQNFLRSAACDADAIVLGRTDVSPPRLRYRLRRISERSSQRHRATKVEAI